MKERENEAKLNKPALQRWVTTLGRPLPILAPRRTLGIKFQDVSKGLLKCN